MSMEFIALIDSHWDLTSASMNKRAVQLHIPVIFTSDVDLRTHKGFLPVQLAGEKSGVEIYCSDDPDALALLPPHEAGNLANPTILELRWGSSLQEGAAAMYIGFLLGKAFNASLFEPDSGHYVSADIALQGAEIMASMARSNHTT